MYPSRKSTSHSQNVYRRERVGYIRPLHWSDVWERAFDAVAPAFFFGRLSHFFSLIFICLCSTCHRGRDTRLVGKILLVGLNFLRQLTFCHALHILSKNCKVIIFASGNKGFDIILFFRC